MQRKLFYIGGYLAYEEAISTGLKSTDITFEERQIDDMDKDLVPLRQFVLPSGLEASGVCHVCWTVCRRTERRMVSLCNAVDGNMDEIAFRYIIRLSDYFLCLRVN